MKKDRRRIVRWLLVGLAILAGVGLRALRIDDEPLWVDEAESSINGLTILQHGVPVNHYQGQPIYENVMYRPWPESTEYEFKDLSYSDQGVAVYHGWLPLYSIALSEWLFGVRPDELQRVPAVQHDAATIRRRTWVPRVPSLFYSAGFLFLLYITGRSMAGEPAGLAALVFAGLGEKFIWFGSQARYYSATLCMDALCAWALWQCIRRGGRRDFLLLSAAQVLLFHTHVMSCVAVAVTTAFLLPTMFQRSGLLTNVCLAATIFLLGTLPWAWLSGLIGHAQGVPAARELLVWPDDILHFATARADASLLLLLSLLGVALILFLNPRKGWLATEEVVKCRQACVLCSVWLCVAYALFFLLMPAASFFWVRMTMTLETPALLLLATGLSNIALVWSRTYAAAATVAVMVLFLVVTGRIVSFGPDGDSAFAPLTQVVDELREHQWRPDTKFYCSPNFHLVYGYYSGLPVQSIAPIRETYLDNYPGPIVLVMPYLLLNGRELEMAIRQAADQAGRSPEEAEIKQAMRLINRRLFYEQLRPRVASIAPEPVLPKYLHLALDASRKLFSAEKSPPWVNSECPVMLRGFTVTTYEQWWVHYFYRFVDPQSRLEEHANFAQRLRTGRLKMLSRGNAICYIPPIKQWKLP